MSSSDTGANGETQNVARVHVPTLVVTLDPVTFLVNFKCDGVKIAVAQMMLDEVQRQLDIQRRAAASIELQKQLQDAARTAALVAGIRGRG